MKKQPFFVAKITLFLFTFQLAIGQVYDNSFSPTAESIRMAPTPNSPEAQAFTKYGNTPVNMYTGSPNIQIPIYTHKGRELDLPISLSYDASGIKVEQLATTVGLGWNLNVGGRISRITNGQPDDFHNTSHTYGPYKSFWDSEVNSKMLLYDDLSSNPSFGGPSGKQDLLDYMYFLKKANDNEYDIQPDYFSFNALGNSDMFVIDVASKLPKALNNPRIDVSLVKNFPFANSTIDKWTIIMDDGTKYEFEEQEITKETNLNDNGAQNFFGFKKEYTSSWLLTKITSANGKDIYEFEYHNLGFWGSNRTASLLTGVTNVVNCSGPNLPKPTNLMGYSSSDYTIKQLVLSKIMHNGKRIVELDLLSLRLDISVNSAIEKIHIYNDDTSNHAADLYKSFTFNYDYFKTTNISPPFDIYDQINIRLKLNSLDYQDSNSATVYSYSFDYLSPDDMPPTTSLGQDYYGYSNGITTNQYLFPTYSDPCVPNDGGNRNTNFTFAKRGTLNKITYPTGGHTEFEYEPNYEKEVTGTSTSWQTVSSIGIAYPTLPAYDFLACNSSFLAGPQTPYTTSDVFEVTQYQADYKMIYDQVGTLLKGYDVQHMASLVKIASPTATLTWTDIYDNNCNIKAGVDVVWDRDVVFVSGQTELFPSSSTITLDTGYYQLVLANPSTTLSNSFEAQKGVQVTNYTYNEKAGMRVKDIKDFTDATTLALHKTYEYPSGTVISDPRHTYTSTQYSLDDGGQVVTSTILHRLSNAKGTDKPHVGYTAVIEKYLDINNDDNGKTSHSFYSTTAGNYRAGVYHYYINGKETANQYGKDYELGKPQGTSVFDKNDYVVSTSNNSYNDLEYYSNTGIYLHIDESKNDLFPVPVQNPISGDWYISYVVYDKGGNLYSPSMEIGSMDGGVQLHKPNECNDMNIWGTAGTASDLCQPSIGRLHKQTTKAWGKAGNIIQSTAQQYYDNESKIVQQSTDYSYYDSISKGPINYLLQKTSTTNSLGETVEQELLYPDNLGYTSLISKNMLNIPVQSKVYKNGNLLSNKKTKYSSSTLPDKIQTAKGSQGLEDRLFFERYENDNVVQIRQTDGLPTAYIWGHEGRYVVAKVENATYDQIEGLNSFGIGFSISADLSTTQDSQLRSLSGALVTTYTYEPAVGVQTIKDPMGQTITYHYDAMHRLEYITDTDDKVVSKNEYNYKN